MTANAQTHPQTARRATLIRLGGFIGGVTALAFLLLIVLPQLAATQRPGICLDRASQQWGPLVLIEGSYHAVGDTSVFSARQTQGTVLRMRCTFVSTGPSSKAVSNTTVTVTLQ